MNPGSGRTHVLPILHGERLIGRVSPRLDRRRAVLEIEGVHAEPTAPASRPVVTAVGRAITALAGFLGADRIEHSAVMPDRWRDHLTPVLERYGGDRIPVAR